MSDKHRNLAVRSATNAYCERLLQDIIGPIREVAYERGYAVAVHGSLANDIDLLAAPWVDHAGDPDELAKAIQGAVAGIVGKCLLHAKDGKLHGDKPHGRRAYTLMLWPLSYIDLSVMPRQQPEAQQ